jgi:sigma-E factor negative regulatory protein RseC
MPLETGRVVAIEADAVWVETIRRSACGGCAAQKGCGQALLNRGSDKRSGRIRVLPGALPASQLSIDDEVVIDIADDTILRGSLVAYGIPLSAMVTGAIAAVQWLPGNQDMVAVFGACAGLLLGFALVRLHGVRHRGDPAFEPVLCGVAADCAKPATLR